MFALPPASQAAMAWHSNPSICLCGKGTGAVGHVDFIRSEAADHDDALPRTA